MFVDARRKLNQSHMTWNNAGIFFRRSGKVETKKFEKLVTIRLYFVLQRPDQIQFVIAIGVNRHDIFGSTTHARRGGKREGDLCLQLEIENAKRG